MPSHLPYEPRQQQLLPSALYDWLPEGHLAYYVGDVIDSLDLSAFHARYEGGGPRNQPFHPAMMVKVLADAGYRSEAVFAQLQDHPTELIVALGREGKAQVRIDSQRRWLSEPPNGWIKNVLGFHSSACEAWPRRRPNGNSSAQR